MEAGVTKVLCGGKGRCQPPSKSTRRSTSTTMTDADCGWARCRSRPEHVWSTDASRLVSGAQKSRSRSVEARSRSRCCGCGASESMETLDVRLLSPDSGAIVFTETPENELTSSTPDWPNEVGVHNRFLSHMSLAFWCLAHYFRVPTLSSTTVSTLLKCHKTRSSAIAGRRCDAKACQGLLK